MESKTGSLTLLMARIAAIAMPAEWRSKHVPVEAPVEKSVTAWELQPPVVDHLTATNDVVMLSRGAARDGVERYKEVTHKPNFASHQWSPHFRSLLLRAKDRNIFEDSPFI